MKLISFLKEWNWCLETCNNDKNLSEIQLEHEKEDELVAVVVKRSCNVGLSKTLMIKERRMKKVKVVVNSSGTLSRRSKTQNLMNFFWLTRSAKLMLKFLERFWIFKELKEKNSLSRSTRGVVIQDPPSTPKAKLVALKLKLKGVQSLITKEQEAVDTMKALKESKKTNRRQPDTRGSSEGAGVSPKVPDKSIVVRATSSERTDTKPGVLDEEKVISKENVILEWGSEQESKYSKEDHRDDEEVDWIDFDEDEEKKDDTKDDKSIDLEMTDDEFVHGDEQVNGDDDEEMLNVKVEDYGKVALATTLLPPSSISTIPPIPHPKTAPIPTSPIITDAPTITTAVPKSDALFTVQLRIAKLEKDVSEMKKMDHFAKALATLKHTADLIQKYPVKPAPNSSKSQKLTVNPEQESEMSALDIRKNQKSESSKKPSTTKETPKGKAPSKSSKTSKSASAKEPVKEPIPKVLMDEAFNIEGEDVVSHDDQPQDTSKPKTNKTPNQDRFKHPSRLPTLDPE
nr:hypothetical protein [Tanacetum cinerariifolium]